jgi:hypothetical protein
MTIMAITGIAIMAVSLTSAVQGGGYCSTATLCLMPMVLGSQGFGAEDCFVASVT